MGRIERVTVSVKAEHNGGAVQFRCPHCGELLEEDFPAGFVCKCGNRAGASEAKRAVWQAFLALIETAEMLDAVT